MATTLRRAILVALAVMFVAPAGHAQAQFDDTPAGLGEWGFRPTEGGVSATNPPGFCWRPQEGARVYALEVARDEAFVDIVYEAQGIELNVHCPPLILPTGHLYWRVASWARTTCARSGVWCAPSASRRMRCVSPCRSSANSGARARNTTAVRMSGGAAAVARAGTGE